MARGWPKPAWERSPSAVTVLLPRAVAQLLRRRRRLLDNEVGGVDTAEVGLSVGQGCGVGSSLWMWEGGEVADSGGTTVLDGGSEAPINLVGRRWVLQLKGVERHELGRPLEG
jgi:hypothetical protein